jgi:hypothetical protein
VHPLDHVGVENIPDTEARRQLSGSRLWIEERLMLWFPYGNGQLRDGLASGLRAFAAR